MWFEHLEQSTDFAEPVTEGAESLDSESVSEPVSSSTEPHAEGAVEPSEPTIKWRRRCRTNVASGRRRSGAIGADCQVEAS